MDKKAPKPTGKPKQDPGVDVLPPEIEAELEPELLPVVAPPMAAPGRPIGVKEVIPFSWKVVGRSGDLMLTLFKSIDRKESEAQFERLLGEGYYKNLAILENDAVVVQPKPPAGSPGKKAKVSAKGKDSSAAKSKPKTTAKGKIIEKPTSKKAGKATSASKGKEKPSAKPAKKRG